MTNEKIGFTFIDLFAGIGGLRIPFENIGGKCVFSSEIDRFARETYHANFGEVPYGDITDPETIEAIPNEFDLLLGGFPCQPFSIAGVSKKNSLGRPHGFEDPERGNMFLEIEKILRDRRPRCFVLENVKHLLTHDYKRTYKIIINKLEALNYHVEARVINALGFLPQNRQRVVIAGFNNDLFKVTDFDTNFGGIWEDLKEPPEDSHTMRDILHPEDGSEDPENDYIIGQKGLVNSKYILTPGVWESLQKHKDRHRSKGNGFGYSEINADSTKSRTLSARYYKDGGEILVNRGEHEIPRRLTPRECARLMGFQDSFKIPVSDVQAYKQFGNSVAIPVFDEVARIMKPYLS